ncbi:hypothetical protein [Burkholderia cepacia]|uniref:hypothetical protein n=1 Tax=Burkholderia cepacia TaxID=292 RepID=UPI002FE31DBB
MVKLVESSQWEEDLYQIETADPVEGGPDGVSNKQAKQLGGRTRYLRAQVEQTQTGLAQHIAAADPHTQYATKTDLAAKLAALVGQSPQSLDTLKELADALGNDPNFATTIINALAQKAAIDSQTFTGTPKGPTAPQFDNSTRLATTAFIQRQGLKASGFEVYTATATLPASVCGAVIYTGGPSAFTLTLPPASAVPGGARIEVYSMAGAGVAFSAQGSDTIPATGSKTIVLNAGDTMALQSNGIDHWELVGGSVALLYASVMAGANWKTPPQFDSSGKLATTAFVQKSAGNFQARMYVIGSGTLAASDTGSWIQAGGNGPSTITLPAPTAFNLTYTITNVTNNSTAVTIATPSANIYNQAMGAPTFLIDVGATVELVSDGSNWTVISHYTRSPIAQSPAQFDNSTRLATTAFVQQALGNYRSARGYVGNATLGAIDIGAMITWDGNGTLTLPDATAFPGGAAIRVFKYAGPIASVLAANKPGQLNVPTSGADTYTFAVGVYGFFELINESSMKWDVAGELFNRFGTTAAAGDNSTRLATTAFVKQAGESFSGIQGINATASLNGGHVGAFLWAYGAGITLTLPPVAGVPNGATITIATPVGITVKGNGTENINNQSGGLSNTFALNAGEQAQFVSNTGAWYLSSYTTVLGTTPAPGDNSTKLATTEFVQRATAAVVGSMRNAAMGVPVASASATFTADEIVVENALGGVAYKLANFNEAINLATTGMDTGSAPVSGYVGLYAGYNPSTGARKLFASNATSTVLGSVYGGSNPPAGIAATALVSVWPTNGNGQFVPGLQIDREIGIASSVVLTTSTPQASLTPFSAASAIPPNARTCRLDLTIGSATASSGANLVVTGVSLEVGRTSLGATSPTAGATTVISTPFIPIVTPQTLYYRASVSSGALNVAVGVNAYTF